MDNLGLGSHVVMRKQHACGTNEFEVVKFGADVKIRCVHCDRVILMPRIEFKRKVKVILK